MSVNAVCRAAPFTVALQRKPASLRHQSRFGFVNMSVNKKADALAHDRAALAATSRNHS